MQWMSICTTFYCTECKCFQTRLNKFIFPDQIKTRESLRGWTQPLDLSSLITSPRLLSEELRHSERRNSFRLITCSHLVNSIIYLLASMHENFVAFHLRWCTRVRRQSRSRELWSKCFFVKSFSSKPARNQSTWKWTELGQHETKSCVKVKEN